MCFSFFFKRKETTIGVLTTLLTLLVLIPIMMVNLSLIGARPELSDKFHIAFTFINPFYAFVGALSKIFEVKTIYIFENFHIYWCICLFISLFFSRFILISILKLNLKACRSMAKCHLSCILKLLCFIYQSA